MFKVVYRTKKGKLVSALTAALGPDLTLEYVPGVPTTPEVGRLFVCRDLRRAEQMLHTHCRYPLEIWTCDATDVEPCRIIHYVWAATLDRIKEWWGDRDSDSWSQYVNTHTASSVTLLERIV